MPIFTTPAAAPPIWRERDLHFVGLGVSGGEAGARHGPSLMVGGSDHSWQQVRPILTAIAARHAGEPCVAHLGPDGAGHFVKTVHNGIEYADMQIIAEIYGLLRGGAAMPPAAIGAVFARWNDGPLRSYLVEITAGLLGWRDPETGHPMVDVITDAAGQKGTGRWTVIEALRLGQSASMIEAAVGARGWSSEKATRQAAGGCSAARWARSIWPRRRWPRRFWRRAFWRMRRGSACWRGVDGLRLGAGSGRDRADLAGGLHHPLGAARRDRRGVRRRAPRGHLILAPGVAARLAARSPRCARSWAPRCGAVIRCRRCRRVWRGMTRCGWGMAAPT